MQFSYIIFDLDGTISNPSEGIKNSLKHTIEKMGINFELDKHFIEFIGPPLHDGFRNVMGMNESDAETAVAHFREYYGRKGLYENILYSGVEDLLKKLKHRNRHLYVATSKLEQFASEVLKYFGIYDLFDFVSGASYRGQGAEKNILIEKIVGRIPKFDPGKFVMIGDTRYDIEAANEFNISSIGVLYGYGNQDELERAGAYKIVNNVADLNNLLFSDI